MNFVAWDHDFTNDEDYWKGDTKLRVEEVESGKNSVVSIDEIIPYSKCFELGQYISDNPEGECARKDLEGAKKLFEGCSQVGDKAFKYQYKVLRAADSVVCSTLKTRVN